MRKQGHIPALDCEAVEYCDSRLIDAVGEIESAERGSQKTTYVIGHTISA